MKRAIPAAAATCLLALAGVSPALADPPANAGPPEGQICAELDSGKIDVSGDMTSITIEAPEGMSIVGVCVKAGSAKQGLGAFYIPVYGLSTVTVEHFSGKDISHYSVAYQEGGSGS